MAKDSGRTEEEKDTKKGRSKSLAFDFAIGWMHKFVMHTDAMPTNGLRNLPSCLTKSAVYNIYAEETRKANRPVLAMSTFLYNMWKVHFPDVVIPKVRKVDSCFNF